MQEDSGLILLGLKNDHGSATATLHLSVLGERRAPARPGWAPRGLRTELDSGLRMGLNAGFAARRRPLLNSLTQWPWASQLTFLSFSFSSVIECLF